VTPGSPNVEANIFLGKRICATRMPQNYANSRYSLKKGCAKGYKTCTGISSKNRVCIPSVAKCPITDMHFVHKSEQTTKGYTYVKLNADFQIGVSRAVDKLPVTLIKL